MFISLMDSLLGKIESMGSMFGNGALWKEGYYVI